ncbi:unnamed protein product [Rotaria sp. Silwood2]|nr:unnamed protein product [Rotaria sp. Silwood2]CAF2786637.1 unnamed protein product [Rotaria sp. Silwood2]CAF3975825.1 unnamed protein product [Rotaria sp. Silwood2]
MSTTLNYSSLQGPSLSVCDNRLMSKLLNKKHRLFLHSPNYPRFWLMINSDQSLQVSNNNRIESTSITTTTSTSLIPLTESSHLNHNNIKHNHTLSYILILTVVFIVILILIILC